MNQQQTRRQNKRYGERGSVLAIASMSMVSLVLAAGMAIDISHLYAAKAELQNAADAAALAGASQLSSTSGGIKQAVAAPSPLNIVKTPFFFIPEYFVKTRARFVGHRETLLLCFCVFELRGQVI